MGRAGTGEDSDGWIFSVAAGVVAGVCANKGVVVESKTKIKESARLMRLTPKFIINLADQNAIAMPAEFFERKLVKTWDMKVVTGRGTG